MVIAHPRAARTIALLKLLCSLTLCYLGFENPRVPGSTKPLARNDPETTTSTTDFSLSLAKNPVHQTTSPTISPTKPAMISRHSLFFRVWNPSRSVRRASCRLALHLHTPQSATGSLGIGRPQFWATSVSLAQNTCAPVQLAWTLSTGLGRCVPGAAGAPHRAARRNPRPINRDASKASRVPVNQISGGGFCRLSAGSHAMPPSSIPDGSE